MKKTFLFWLMFVLAICMAIYFSVRIIMTTYAPRADLDTFASTLATRPELRASAIRALPNGKYTTRAETHQTIAYLYNGDVFYPLTADGTAVQQPIDTRPDNAIVFRGKVPNNITEIVNMAKKIAPYIDHLAWIENRRWNITTTGGITIMLPETDMAGAFDTLVQMQNKNGILDRNIKTLDLRDNARILVK